MSPETTMRDRGYVVRTTCVVFSSFRRESCGVRNARFKLLGGEMPQNIRDVMTSNPCTIDAEKSVAYAAKMMLEEDVGPRTDRGGRQIDRDADRPRYRNAGHGKGERSRSSKGSRRGVEAAHHRRSRAGSGRGAAKDGPASGTPSTGSRGRRSARRCRCASKLSREKVTTDRRVSS